MAKQVNAGALWNNFVIDRQRDLANWNSIDKSAVDQSILIETEKEFTNWKGEQEHTAHHDDHAE